MPDQFTDEIEICDACGGDGITYRQQSEPNHDRIIAEWSVTCGKCDGAGRVQIHKEIHITITPYHSKIPNPEKKTV